MGQKMLIPQYIKKKFESFKTENWSTKINQFQISKDALHAALTCLHYRNDCERYTTAIQSS